MSVARQRQGRLRLPAGDGADDGRAATPVAPRARRRAIDHESPRAAEDLQARPPGRGAARGTCPTAASGGSRSPGRWPPRPRLLLLDEPAAGMNPHEAHELMELIRWIRDQFGMAILLVEHNMKVVMGICETRPRARLRRHDRRRARRPRSRATRRSSRPTWGARERDPRGPRPARSRYGAIKALKGVSLVAVAKGEIVTLIGANGAGKTTTLRAIMGLVPGLRRRGPLRGRADPLARPRTGSCARASSLVPGGPRRLREPDRARRTSSWAPTRGATARIAARPRAGLRAVPAPEGAAQADGGHALGRRAADAGDRPRADVAAEGPAPRRAVAGPGAASSCTPSSRRSRRSTRRARPCCWSSRTPTPPCKHSNRAYVLETGTVALEGTSAEVAANPKVKEAYLGE